MSVGWVSGTKTTVRPSSGRGMNCCWTTAPPSLVTVVIRSPGVHSAANQQMRIVMLAKTEAPNPGAIAARVAKSQEHIEVECELSTQRAALEPITAELRELYTKNAGNLERVGRDINRLNERGEVFSKRVNELRAK